jgi:hypothetical protein
LIAAMPITGTVAAVRPSVAVPTAGSTAVAAQDYGRGEGVAWLPLGIIIATVILALYIAADKPGRGRGNLSRG